VPSFPAPCDVLCNVTGCVRTATQHAPAAKGAVAQPQYTGPQTTHGLHVCDVAATTSHVSSPPAPSIMPLVRASLAAATLQYQSTTWPGHNCRANNATQPTSTHGSHMAHWHAYPGPLPHTCSPVHPAHPRAHCATPHQRKLFTRGFLTGMLCPGLGAAGPQP
jgi:hypothetical protein